MCVMILHLILGTASTERSGDRLPRLESSVRELESIGKSIRRLGKALREEGDVRGWD